ncbi:Tex family protein [Calditrichota bacterium LG25]
MTEIEMIQLVAEELNLKALQVKNTIELLDTGNTVPFIARYRKEVTGSLDENQIRAIQDRMQYLRALEARKETILKSIEEQGKLTPELKEKILKATKLQEVEDLYLPYKPKKRTRATVAREKGLEPLAEIILKQEVTEGSAEEIAVKFVNEEKEVRTVQEALQGAMDIVAEVISDDAEVRKQIREATFKTGLLESAVKKADERTPYEMYYDYSEPVNSIPPHRILAINRGETEGVLKVSVEVDSQKMIGLIEALYVKNEKSIFIDYLRQAIADSFTRLIFPSIQREVRSALTEKADEHAIAVFAENLRNLLLQPPVRGKMIMGIDPGFRTGCKVAVIDQTGKYLEGATIYPHPPQERYLEAKSIVRALVNKYQVNIIAIGNGTASRETEMMVAELIREMKDERKVEYIIVNEAGASVYSASKVAQEEFPDLEAAMRGNISIARRLLDPLAELVKIDPKHIGVGLYQHDVNQKRLAEALQQVVESAVNMVGVNVNTASASLLKYVSGLTSRTANSIVKYRDEHGPFRNREEIKKVDGIGEVAYQQAAGFLRIPDGDNPLDNTSIHPESYEATRKLLEKFKVDDIHQGGKLLRLKIKQEKVDIPALLEELGIGEPTFNDILDNLEKPGLDPRDELPKPIFKSDVLKMEDLREGMILKGTVRNVVDFGAFVDIGVKQDGLVHVSRMAKKFVKNPYELLSVGDVIEVKVVSIDLERGRIGLSMVLDE